jgi:hypothetical protein
MLRTILGIGALALMWTSPAAAQMVCTERADVVTHLGKKFSEAPVALGVASNGGVVEVLTNESGESWTIIITMPNGMTCMLASGENWEAIPLIPVGPHA